MEFEFRGHKPQIHPEAFVAPNATLVGDVTVGRDSSVWFGAVLRGDGAPIRVGEGTSIQDNAVLHCRAGGALTVGGNVTVGHGAIVHCTAVGDNTLVGMGAVLLDGAVIGSNCIIAAGAVVKEGCVVPDGTMMAGVPARAVRTLAPEQLAFLAQPSAYVALSKEYME